MPLNLAAALAALLFASPCSAVTSAVTNRDMVEAADRGDVDAMHSMLAAGADVDGEWGGGTPLILSAMRCRADAVTLLLQFGANVNGTAQCGDSALMLAAWKCPTGLVQELLDRGANVNDRDCDGETSLGNAAQAGRTETVELLLSHGADIDTRTIIGFTPLSLAYLFMRWNTAKLLRAKGANLYSALWPLAAALAALVVVVLLARRLRRWLVLRNERARDARIKLLAGS